MAQAPQPNQTMTDQQRKALDSVTPPKDAKDQRISTQNHLMFSEIRDNIVIMRDGSLRMVILSSSLNFDLKSAREQDAIEFSFQNFLNGLHFPIQVIIRSRKIDLDNYLNRLEGLQAEQENPLLAGLMEDYVYNIRGLLEDVNIMDKSFYVIVPYFVKAVSKDNIVTKIGGLLKPSEDVVQTDKDFEEHKRDLIQRTNIVAQGLAQVGIRAAVLTTQELIELYYGSYNIDEAQNQPLGDVSTLSTPIVGRTNPQPVPHGPEQRTAEPEDMFAAARRAGHGAGQHGSPMAAAVAQGSHVKTAAPATPHVAVSPAPHQAPVAPTAPHAAAPTNVVPAGQSVSVPTPQAPQGGQK